MIQLICFPMWCFPHMFLLEVIYWYAFICEAVYILYALKAVNDRVDLFSLMWGDIYTACIEGCLWQAWLILNLRQFSYVLKVVNDRAEWCSKSEVVSRGIEGY